MKKTRGFEIEKRESILDDGVGVDSVIGSTQEIEERLTALGKHHYMVGTPLKICKRGCDAGSALPSVVCAAPASAVMHVLFLVS
ncbi:hypothetical protein C5167_028378 [Papaver somniferum]|nr:hypothetical protein C5167_028378 [Papaver somniferum]